MQATIPNIKTAAPKFSKADVDRIAKTAAEVEAVNERMNALHDRRSVKRALAEAPNAYASGTLDLGNAILATASVEAAADEVVATLRGACKDRLKHIFLSVQDDIRAADAHRVSELARIASEQEKSERADAGELGIAADDFAPSPLLERLRETHKRAHAALELDSRRPPSAADFQRLLGAIA